MEASVLAHPVPWLKGADGRSPGSRVVVSIGLPKGQVASVAHADLDSPLTVAGAAPVLASAAPDSLFASRWKTVSPRTVDRGARPVKDTGRDVCS
jgi:hypothetical protein